LQRPVRVATTLLFKLDALHHDFGHLLHPPVKM
jgi:hypothetical protein